MRRARFVSDAPRRKPGKERTAEAKRTPEATPQGDADWRWPAREGMANEQKGETSAPAMVSHVVENANRGFDLGRQRDGCLSDEPSCAGLHPEDNLVIVERVQGRANRPYQRRSTVARVKAACRQWTMERGSVCVFGFLGVWVGAGD